MKTIRLHYLNYILVVLILILACTKKDVKENKNPTEVQEKSVAVSPKIYVSIDIEQLSTSKKGDEVLVSLDDGTEYTLQISRIEETMPGIISVTGNLGTNETGQAVFILRDGKLAGMVNMYADGSSYKLAYDDDSKRHYISLINPDDKDNSPDAAPLILD